MATVSSRSRPRRSSRCARHASVTCDQLCLPRAPRGTRAGFPPRGRSPTCGPCHTSSRETRGIPATKRRKPPTAAARHIRGPARPPQTDGIMSHMPDRYAYLGPEGTFTEAALQTLDEAAVIEPRPYPTVEATLDADGQIGAALAGAFAAPKYGLAVLGSDVNDHEGAGTRFVVVSTPGRLPARTGSDRTSLVAFLAEDHPGALAEILTEFAVRGVNLTRLESRPTGDMLGRYCFSIDCEGHIDEARVGEALMGLRRACANVRFLGSYPRRDGGTARVRPGTSDAEFADATAWLARLRYGRV